MNNSIFNPESVNRTRYLSCKCHRPPPLPPLPSPRIPSHAESVVHQTSCSLASVHSVFTPRSRFRRCTCIRIGDTCTRPLHRTCAHTHVHPTWWGGKGARWVNRVSAKRWVAISEFLVGKHRHDGPWSRLRAQSCIGDSIGRRGKKGRGDCVEAAFQTGASYFSRAFLFDDQASSNEYIYIYMHAFPRLATLGASLFWWMRFVSAWISG